MREIVLYVPSGGYPATADITRGSAIVGESGAGAEVEVYFEGAIFGQENMRTLADRATHAAGPPAGCWSATTAARIVPRDALLAVGTFDFRKGQITLTGSDSERAVAAWLGTPQLDPAELAQGARQAARAADVAHLVPDVTVTVNRSLGEALIERAAIRRDGDGLWVDEGGCRTSAIAEALIWALVAIAEEE